MKLFVGSQLEWLLDERQLPFWTYAAPSQRRDMAWLAAWANPETLAFGLRPLTLVDVRPAEAFQLGHLPNARSVPGSTLRALLAQPRQLAEALAGAGVKPSDEAVLAAD